MRAAPDPGWALLRRVRGATAQAREAFVVLAALQSALPGGGSGAARRCRRAKGLRGRFQGAGVGEANFKATRQAIESLSPSTGCPAREKDSSVSLKPLELPAKGRSRVKPGTARFQRTGSDNRELVLYMRLLRQVLFRLSFGQDQTGHGSLRRRCVSRQHPGLSVVNLREVLCIKRSQTATNCPARIPPVRPRPCSTSWGAQANAQFRLFSSLLHRVHCLSRAGARDRPACAPPRRGPSWRQSA